MTTFHATTPHFRGDIQGLRGIAVLLVVLFHAGVTTLSGGFIGVDIFFVISGYVISGLLIREIDSADVAKGSIGIDFPNFYARRLRRLLPAAIIVIVTTSVAAWFIYAPLELKIYITSAFAALVYISNLRYAESATNYFAESADADPFLHTWSLAVEEQFYILWPLLLFLVIRGAPKAAIRQRLILTMVLIGAGSLALSIYFTHHNQPWAFFNPLTRAWEFALGALAYIIGTRECVRTISWAPLLQWTGLLALAAAALTFNAHTRFPGFAALIPTIGTFAVLLTYVSPSRSILTRWLESAPMRLCGDISYSWYLWHWAIFVFGRELFGLGSPAVRALMLGLSLALAWVTYVLVENPVRQGRSKMLSQPKKTLLIGLITTMTIAIAILAARQVLKRELDTDRQRPFAVAREDIPQDKQGCHLGYLPTTQPECAYGDPSSSHVVVLFGDSHAAQWLPALEQSAKERHWKLYWWTKSGCPSGGVTLFAENLNRSYDECDRWRDQALAKIEVLRPAVVVLANSSHYVTGNRRTAASTTSALWQAGLETTIGRLSAADIRVAIIGDTPWPTGNVPFCLSKAIWHNARADTCAFDPVDEARAALRSIETAVAARFANARYLRTDELVCPISPCPVLQDGVVAYVDDNHISATLSRRLGEALADRITTLFPVR